MGVDLGKTGESEQRRAADGGSGLEDGLLQRGADVRRIGRIRIPRAAHDAFSGVALQVLYGEVADELVVLPVAPCRNHFLRIGRRQVRSRKLAVHLLVGVGSK